MIPKIIHYCWFGRNPLPEEAKKCIESWKKYFPNYEIIEWNEDNFDINCCDYVKEAYQKKKWAFVSDYARFDILYKYGGIYFDTDVEVIKSMDDILEIGPFMGLESGKLSEGQYIKKDINYHDEPQNEDFQNNLRIAPGLGIAAPKGMDIYGQILTEYKKRHFIKKNGYIDIFTVVLFVTNILLSNGIEVHNGIGYSMGINIYPVDYFCPKDYISGIVKITDNTRSIHHYSATWVSPIQKKIHSIEMNYVDKYGIEIGLKKAKRVTFVFRVINAVQTKKIGEKVKTFFNNKLKHNKNS